MKRLLCLLAAVLLALLLCACAAEEAPGEEADHSHDLPWRDALMDSSLPDGYATPDTVSFCISDDQGVHVENVSFSEISAYLDAQQHLPKTDRFDDLLPERVRAVLPVLDYAYCHSSARLCVPTTELEGTELFAASRWLGMIYHVNDSGVTGRTISSFQNAEGETVNYVFISFNGMNLSASGSRHGEAMAEAKRIVASVPEGADEVETARYLYQYLTDHVAYDDNEYYAGNWDLLYDALIGGRTVCAGYEEALYTLYNLAGIECFPVSGAVYGSAWDDYGGGHIWSIAKLNGEYYEFDPTWDAGVPPEQYRFFAISTEDMQAYYPRVYDALTEEYAPPRPKTLGS